MFRWTNPGAARADEILSNRNRYASTTWRNRSSWRAALSGAGVMALAISASGQVLADSGGGAVTAVDHAVIEVASDGQEYTMVLDSSPSLTGRMAMRLDAHRFGAIRSWAFWTSIQAGALQKKQFPELGYSKSYAVGDRPKTVSRDLPFSIPRSAYRAYAKEVCNRRAEILRSYHGKTDEEIFAVDHSIPVAFDAEITWDMSGAANDAPDLPQLDPPAENPNIKPVTIVCRKTVMPVPTPLMVKADLEVAAQDEYRGACSLRLMTAIETKQPNADVWFRFESEGGRKSDLKTVTTGADATSQTFYDYDLPAGGGRKTGKVRVAVEGQNFTSAWADYEVQCGPNVDSFATLLPPKAEELHVGATIHKTSRRTGARTFICPARAKIIGLVKGRSDVSDIEAILYAEDVLKNTKIFDIEEGETVVVESEHELNWGGQIVYGDAPMQQSVPFRMVINNTLDDPIDQIEKTHTFTCEEVQTMAVAEDLAGQMVANAELAHTKVEQQLSLTFAIIAPRSVVRNGQIRLSGVASDQVFKLSFQRKTNGSYKTVHPQVAQVPQEMTGATASFSSDAMEPGNWRLRVCPIAANGQIAQGNDCRQSDFVLPQTATIGGIPGAAGGKAGSNDKAPKPKTLHITPGLGG